MTRTIIFDATRLVTRLERSAPTGVDRVCLAYAEWLLAKNDIILVPVRSRSGRLVALKPDWFARQVAEMRVRWSDHDRPREIELEAALWRSLREPRETRNAVRSPPPRAEPKVSKTKKLRLLPRIMNSRPLPAQPNAIYLNVGHTGLEQPDILSAMRDAGHQVIVLLHDLIPITHPEYCRPGDDLRHHQRVETVLRYATAVIVNSAYTGHEFTKHALARDVQPPPIHVAHLGLDPVFAPQIRTARNDAPYFLHIGTIEARKNLAFLLALWRRLDEALGHETPQLVLVGRFGWENEAVLDHLERTPGFDTLVHQVSGLADAALANLIANARAVLAPSSVEGFDLPAVEARVMGTHLIASDIEAHREVAPDAVLVDPLDGPAWIAAIIDALKSPSNQPVSTGFTWAQHFLVIERLLSSDFDHRANA